MLTAKTDQTGQILFFSGRTGHFVGFAMWQLNCLCYRKQLIDEDKRELMRFQEVYLPDGDLHTEGAGRMRRFRWNNNGE